MANPLAIIGGFFGFLCFKVGFRLGFVWFDVHLPAPYNFNADKRKWLRSWVCALSKTHSSLVNRAFAWPMLPYIQFSHTCFGNGSLYPCVFSTQLVRPLQEHVPLGVTPMNHDLCQGLATDFGHQGPFIGMSANLGGKPRCRSHPESGRKKARIS